MTLEDLFGFGLVTGAIFVYFWYVGTVRPRAAIRPEVRQGLDEIFALARGWSGPRAALLEHDSDHEPYPTPGRRILTFRLGAEVIWRIYIEGTRFTVERIVDDSDRLWYPGPYGADLSGERWLREKIGEIVAAIDALPGPRTREEWQAEHDRHQLERYEGEGGYIP